MQRNRRNYRKNQGQDRRGMTLLEIMIVLIIIVMIAGLAVVSVLSQRESAQIRTAYSTIVSLSTAVDIFMLDVGRPPTNEEGLAALIHEPPGVEGRWKGPYINERTSRTDPWGNDFLYASPGVNSASRRYEIWSLGPNGASGTAEEIIGHWMPNQF